MNLNQAKESTIAAIDIGTNSAHLVIAKIDDQEHLTILDSDKEILRLGDDLDEHKVLSEESIKRTTKVILQMKEIASKHDPIYRVVATFAVRSARNHQNFIREIHQKTGIEIALIDGIEEARLTSLGMLSGLPLRNQNFLSLDIGGGSTEITIRNNEKITYVASIPLGCVTLSKKYFYQENTQPKTKEILALEKFIAMQLAPIIFEAKKKTYQLAVMSSGTAKALAYMDYYQKNNQELEDPNGYNLKTKEINALVNNMKSLRSPEKIKKYWDLDTNRSEIILAGASILNILTNILGIKQWTVSNYALREGLVIDTYKRLFSGNSHNIESNIRWKSVLRLGNKLEIDSSQAESVLFFAEKIYDFIVKQKLYQDTSDQLSSLSNKELLQAAAWLHECGKFISFPRYHKHSIYLITNYRMLGFSQKERLLMGLVARYHRKGKAAKKNSYCESLSSKEIYLINLLASIIRIASAANRTRKKLIKDMHLEFSKKMITFRLVPNNKESLPSLDLEKMQTEKGGLEKIIGYPITIELL